MFGRRPLSEPIPGVSAEAVRWAYRLLLEREAETDAVINDRVNTHQTLRELRNALLNSPEYYAKNSALRSDMVAWGFRLLLGREPDEDERTLYATAFGSRESLVEKLKEDAQRLPARYEPRAVVIAEFDGTARLFLDLRDKAIGLGVLHGTFEVAETQWWTARARPGGTVVDIGANIGYYTVLAARRIGANGHVHAFEPLAENNELIRRSLVENALQNVTLHEHAVAEVPGRLSIVSLPLARGAGNSGGAYLSADPPAEHEVRTVSVVSLDSLEWPHRVDLIKIDAEGAEGRILKGGMDLFRSHRPLVMCELNPIQLQTVSQTTPAAIIRQFKSLDYDVERLDEISIDRVMEPGDIATIVATPRTPRTSRD